MKRSMIISLIGRPNVGKSTLFNRLMRKSTKAITHDKPGVTRDRHYGIAKFFELPDQEECEGILVDTGGFYPERLDELNTQKREDRNMNKFFNIMTDHAEMAIEESDLVLFVVDVREGILPFDQVIADFIRSKKKNFWLIVNKYDSDSQMGDEAEFYSLGINPDAFFTISSAHGLGIDNLREKIHQEMVDFQNGGISVEAGHLQKGVTPREEVIGRLAIVGAPNAGKSTLLNRLLGAERALVSNIAGTTVDPIEGYFDIFFGKDVYALAGVNENRGYSNDLLIEQYNKFRNNNPDAFRTFMEEGEAADLDQEILEEQINEELLKEDSIKNDEMVSKVFCEEHSLSNGEAEFDEEEEKKGSLWRSLHIVDTAGIRKQKKVHGDIESQSVYRALRCITEADIVIFLVDAVKGIGHQDRRLIGIALEKGKSVIVGLNKIDLLKKQLKTDKDRKEWILDLRAKVPWLDFCEIIPMSAKYNKYIKGLKESIKRTVLVRSKTISTGALNNVVSGLIDRNPVMVKKSNGTRLKIKYASMVKSNPPTFLFFSNRSQGIPENYLRYLKNNLRKEFRLYNTPVHLIFRTGKDLKAKNLQ